MTCSAESATVWLRGVADGAWLLHAALITARPNRILRNSSRFTSRLIRNPMTSSINIIHPAPVALRNAIMASHGDHHRRLVRMYLAAPANEYFKPGIRIGDWTAEVQLTVRPDFFHAAS